MFLGPFCINQETDVDCAESGNTAADCLDSCAVAAATVTTEQSGSGAACVGDYTCVAGDGACPADDAPAAAADTGNQEFLAAQCSGASDATGSIVYSVFSDQECTSPPSDFVFNAMDDRSVCVGESSGPRFGLLSARSDEIDMDLFGSEEDCLAGTSRVTHFEFEDTDLSTCVPDATAGVSSSAAYSCAALFVSASVTVAGTVEEASDSDFQESFLRGAQAPESVHEHAPNTHMYRAFSSWAPSHSVARAPQITQPCSASRPPGSPSPA